MRRLLVFVLVLTAFTSCVEPVCGCTDIPPIVVLKGVVQHADSTPATNAVSWAVLYQDTTCTVPRYPGFTVPVDSTAHYRHELYGQLDRQCVAVYAAPPGTANRQDSVGVTHVHTFRTGYPPDSLDLPVIRLP